MRIADKIAAEIGIDANRAERIVGLAYQAKMELMVALAKAGVAKQDLLETTNETLWTILTGESTDDRT